MTVQDLTGKFGLKDNEAEYKRIHEIYFNGEMLEDDFCADYIAHRESIIIKDLYERCQEYEVLLKESSTALKESSSVQVSASTLVMATAEMLIHKADEHMDEELYDTAINLIGIEACVAYKLNHDLELTKHDKEYILNALKG